MRKQRAGKAPSPAPDSLPRPHSAPGTATIPPSSSSRNPAFGGYDPTRPPPQQPQSALNSFKLEASQQLIPSQSYLQNRAEAVTNIESHIVELGSIFNRLAEMVSEQGHDVQTIYDNTDESLMNVQAGHSELLKFYNNIRGNRALILKIFMVLMAFAGFFILFLA